MKITKKNLLFFICIGNSDITCFPVSAIPILPASQYRQFRYYLLPCIGNSYITYARKQVISKFRPLAICNFLPIITNCNTRGLPLRLISIFFLENHSQRVKITIHLSISFYWKIVAKKHFQRVKINIHLSSDKFDRIGFPQGSVIAHILFLLYINELLNLFVPTVPTCAVRETASLGIMGAPRVPPLNLSESIVLLEHYQSTNKI